MSGKTFLVQLTAGPIDINDQIEETLDAYLFKLIWNLL